MKEKIVLNGEWFVKAPLLEVFNLITGFEKWTENFPKVAESVRVVKREGNSLEIEASVKSFGKKFPVKMSTKILPKKGFVSDNESHEFGTSGHEELLLSKRAGGTVIHYSYVVSIHKYWLRIIAKPLIGWFSMKYWERAVIDELKKKLER